VFGKHVLRKKKKKEDVFLVKNGHTKHAFKVGFGLAQPYRLGLLGPIPHIQVGNKPSQTRFCWASRCSKAFFYETQPNHTGWVEARGPTLFFIIGPIQWPFPLAKKIACNR